MVAALMAVLMLVLPVVTVAQATGLPATMYVQPLAGVNVRSTPDTLRPPIRKAQCGFSVRAVKQVVGQAIGGSTEWLRVTSLGDGVYGYSYIHSSLLVETEPECNWPQVQPQVQAETSASASVGCTGEYDTSGSSGVKCSLNEHGHPIKLAYDEAKLHCWQPGKPGSFARALELAGNWDWKVAEWRQGFCVIIAHNLREV